jgi:hypothetical protein
MKIALIGWTVFLILFVRAIQKLRLEKRAAWLLNKLGVRQPYEKETYFAQKRSPTKVYKLGCIGVSGLDC